MVEHGGWAQLGHEIEDCGTDRITRRVTDTSDGLKIQPGVRVSWSGIYYATPADAGLDAHDVMIETAAGLCPAWKIDGNSTWAVHIHGLGNTCSGTLRGVQVATDLGYSSLVATFRNDREGPAIGTGRSMLGWTEADDVEEAVRYAMRHGAERIVLFGWSMGGAIAIQLALRPHLTPLIAGLVLDSPVLDWSSVIRANCTRAGLPPTRRRPRDPVAQLQGTLTVSGLTGTDPGWRDELQELGSAAHCANSDSARNQRRHSPRPIITRPRTATTEPGRRKPSCGRPHAELEPRSCCLAHHSGALSPANDLSSVTIAH